MNIKAILNTIKKYNYFPKYSSWIFVFLFVAISSVYNYQEILFKPSQSLHQWRQCDCLSLTMNYYQDDNPFFESSVHHQGSDGTGKTVSGFPLIYYGVAQLWKVFGHHEFIYRLVVLLFFFSGLFALFQLFENILKDSILAIIFSLLIFTSPTLVYYANNFLLNVPALSLAFIGLYFFYKFSQSSSTKYLIIAAVFYTVAGLLKVSSLLSFIAIFGLFSLEIINVQLLPNRKLFQQPLKQFFILFSVLIIQLIWYKYASYYNDNYNSGFFLIGILPIWGFDKGQIMVALEFINDHIKWDYFRRETQVLLILMYTIVLVYYKRANRILLLLMGIVSFGVLLFSLLFFQALKDHDYYTINLFVLAPIVLLNFLVLLKKKFNLVFSSVLFKIAAVVFLIHNVDFAKRRLEDRYSTKTWQNENYIQNIQQFEEITPYLRSIGIKKGDRVISLSDESINVSLYVMNQKGWTNYGIRFDSSRINNKIELGAKYLMLYNEDLKHKPFIQPYIKNKIGQYKNVLIYKL